jgi:hypothetical protein
MSNFHLVIVHDIGEMIRRMAVGFQQYRVVIDAVNEIQSSLSSRSILPRRPIDQIVKRRISIRLQSDNMSLPLRSSVLGFFREDVNAMSVISRRKACFVAVPCHCIKTFCTTETAVRMTGSYQIVGMRSIDSCSFGLFPG